jgi:hypothetical protein
MRSSSASTRASTMAGRLLVQPVLEHRLQELSDHAFNCLIVACRQCAANQPSAPSRRRRPKRSAETGSNRSASRRIERPAAYRWAQVLPRAALRAPALRTTGSSSIASNTMSSSACETAGAGMGAGAGVSACVRSSTGSAAGACSSSEMIRRIDAKISSIEGSACGSCSAISSLSKFKTESVRLEDY